MPDRVHAHMFRGLVDQVGGVEAAVAVITARTGHAPSVGTISKVQTAQLEVPHRWIAPLEDAAGTYPFSDLRSAERKRGQDECTSVVDHVHALKETTEMVMAMAAAETDDSPEALAEAIREAQEVAELASKAVEQLRGRLGPRQRGAG